MCCSGAEVTRRFPYTVAPGLEIVAGELRRVRPSYGNGAIDSAHGLPSVESACGAGAAVERALPRGSHLPATTRKGEERG